MTDAVDLRHARGRVVPNWSVSNDTCLRSPSHDRRVRAPPGAAMTRRVLVTGAAGFVGINLVRGFAEAGWGVIATARRDPDPLATAFLAPVSERVAWQLGDVTDERWLDRLVAGGALDTIVHAAAVTPTDAVERGATRQVVDTNLVATLSVLEAVRTHAVPRLLFASSTGLYAGAARHAARREDEVLEPHNLYALCKFASERLVSAYVALHGCSAASVRIGSVYGPMERATRSRTGLSLVASLVAAAEDARPTRVSHPDVGRDLIHAYDVARAFVRLAEAPHLRWGVYNLAGGVPLTVAAVLDELTSLTGVPWTSSDVDEADVGLTPGHHRDHVDLTRLEADTGFTPEVALRDGLAHALAWHQSAGDLASVARFAFRPG
jgi:UDP-glucose 4-epimerase